MESIEVMLYMMSNACHDSTPHAHNPWQAQDPLLSVSLSCPLAPIPNAPWFSSETLALYKSLSYLLTYLQLVNTAVKGLIQFVSFAIHNSVSFSICTMFAQHHKGKLSCKIQRSRTFGYHQSAQINLVILHWYKWNSLTWLMKLIKTTDFSEPRCYYILHLSLRLADTGLPGKSVLKRWMCVLKVIGQRSCIAVNRTPSRRYGVSHIIWDHAVLPETRHKWTQPALTQPDRLVLDFPTLEGWKAELT